MNSEANKKPCLVPAGQGFSVLYNNRFLYSKYSPDSAIKKAISPIAILPNTLVLAFSAVLDYGLDDLLLKLPENSHILVIETDPVLFEFETQHRANIFIENNNISFCLCTQIKSFVSILRELGATNGIFRRSIRIDMSGAVQFSSLYSTFQKTADSAIAQFWKNRMTLTKLGRLYSRNIIRNLSLLPFSAQFNCNSIDKTILIAGAGPSLDEIFDDIKKNANSLFIIAVDNVLPAFYAHGIKPDIVIAVESQLANEKPFIGMQNSFTQLFADFTSRPRIIRHFLKKGQHNISNVTFFVSEYAETGFFKGLGERGLLPVQIPALGSVGVSAVEIALRLRTENTPVLIAGLDFSFIPGKTHCQSSSTLNSNSFKSSRLNPIGNPESAYRTGAKSLVGKNNLKVFTDISLSGYASCLYGHYSHTNMLFDISPFGLNCGIPYLNPKNISNIVHSVMESKGNLSFQNGIDELDKIDLIKRISVFYDEEEKALTLLNKLLKDGGNPEQILNILKNREYLYLHFPDGYKKPTSDISFFKRIRAETDFFLKEIKLGRKTLSKMASSI